MAMKTPLYFKLDPPEQLFLGEGVCWQLGIVTYHPFIFDQRKKKNGQAAKQETPQVDKE